MHQEKAEKAAWVGITMPAALLIALRLFLPFACLYFLGELGF